MRFQIPHNSGTLCHQDIRSPILCAFDSVFETPSLWCPYIFGNVLTYFYLYASDPIKKLV